MKTVAFLNSRGGVGKTSLVYHLAWMYSELGVNVVAADLDPQADLTTMFLDDDALEALWEDGRASRSVMSPMRSLLMGDGGIGEPVYEVIDEIALLAGDLSLSAFEDELNLQWARCMGRDKRAFRVVAALHEVIARCARDREASLVLIDVGPNLGPINRAALIAADDVIVPVAPDFFSVVGLESIGPRLRSWRKGWAERLERQPEGMDLPHGRMVPARYVVMQHAIPLDRPVEIHARWMERILHAYREAVLDETPEEGLAVANDPHCLGTLKPFRSLMDLAQRARKPMFALKAADGAIGGHATAVQDCYRDFRTLAREIANRVGIALS